MRISILGLAVASLLGVSVSQGPTTTTDVSSSDETTISGPPTSTSPTSSPVNAPSGASTSSPGGNSAPSVTPGANSSPDSPAEPVTGSTATSAPEASTTTNTASSETTSTVAGDSTDPDIAVPSEKPRPEETSKQETVPEDPSTYASEPERLAFPLTAISESDAKQLVMMEALYYEEFVQTAPAPGEQPIVLPNFTCPQSSSGKRSMMGARWSWSNGLEDEDQALQKRGLLDFWKLEPPTRPNLDKYCNIVKDLDVRIHFHYFKPKKEDAANDLEGRVTANVAWLQQVYGELNIRILWDGSINYWKNPANRNDVAYAEYAFPEAPDTAWMKRATHKGGKMDLNVWMVHSVIFDGDEINGFSTFPSDNAGKLDGIVVDHTIVNKGVTPTVIHEIGHWLGLYHTFGRRGEDCVGDDGLTKTTRTSGAEDQISECVQTTCDKKEKKEIYNYMSYSACRGKVPDKSFTTDQKSAIFARVLKYRRGYQKGECQVTDPGKPSTGGKRAVTHATPEDHTGLRKRSAMQDVMDGKCPNFDSAAAALVKASLPADVVKEQGGGGENGKKNAADRVVGGLEILGMAGVSAVALLTSVLAWL